MQFVQQKFRIIYITIAINLTIVFAKIVNCASNNYFQTFAPPPMTKSWLRPCIGVNGGCHKTTWYKKLSVLSYENKQV